MDETCDRCGPAYPAAYRVARGDGELFFCLACTSYLWEPLTRDGWVIWPASGHGTAPQAQAG